MSKHVLVFADELPPFCGGAGRMAILMIDALLRIGFEVSVITKPGNRLVQSSIKSIIYAPSPDFLHFYVLSYWYAIRRLNLDSYSAIIINDCKASIAAGVIIPERYFHKCVLLLHGSEPEAIFESNSKFNRFFPVKKKYSALLEQSKDIIAVSQFMKQKFLDISGHSWMEKNTKILYNSYDDQIFYCDTDVLTKSKKSTPVLLSVGRIEEKKGYRRMLRIFKEVLNFGMMYEWWVVGDGSYKNTFMKLAQKEGVYNNIKFLGYVDGDNLRRLYNQADIFWTLSEYQEAFMLVNIEANACGTPVLSANIGGTNESVDHGKSGFIINSDEDCIDVLIKKTYLELLQIDIIKNAQKFSFENYCNKLGQILI